MVEPTMQTRVGEWCEHGQHGQVASQNCHGHQLSLSVPHLRACAGPTFSRPDWPNEMAGRARCPDPKEPTFPCCLGDTSPQTQKPTDLPSRWEIPAFLLFGQWHGRRGEPCAFSLSLFSHFPILTTPFNKIVQWLLPGTPGCNPGEMQPTCLTDRKSSRRSTMPSRFSINGTQPSFTLHGKRKTTGMGPRTKIGLFVPSSSTSEFLAWSPRTSRHGASSPIEGFTLQRYE